MPYLVDNGLMERMRQFLLMFSEPKHLSVKMADKHVLKTRAEILLLDMAMSLVVQDRNLEEADDLSCQWKNCDGSGGRTTFSGVRLCTHHYSQAVGTGKVEVTM